MSPYFLNKTISVAVPFALILVGLVWFDINDPYYWWTLFVLTQTLGFAHYLIGFKYQYAALKKRQNPKQLAWFFGLIILSCVLLGVAYALDSLFLVVMIVIPYFLFHGALNEHTLATRQLTSAPPQPVFVLFGIFITGLFLLSFAHPSFFTGAEILQLNQALFLQHVDFLVRLLPFETFPYLAYGCFSVFLLGVVGWLWREGRRSDAAIVSAVVLAAVSVIVAQNVLHYIILLTLALTYHYVSWSVFYFQEFKRTRPEHLRRYVGEHIVVLFPVTIVAFGALNLLPLSWAIDAWLFNGLLFLSLTTAHISASFLNEQWFRTFIRAD